ncbi:MAG: hypothetical protein AAB225_05040 [Acidobacteriota bacterium]
MHQLCAWSRVTRIEGTENRKPPSFLRMVVGIHHSQQAGARIAFPLKERRHPLEA